MGLEQLPQPMPLAKWTRPQQSLLLLLRCWLAPQQRSSSSLWLRSIKMGLLHKLGLHLALCHHPPVKQCSRRLRQLLSRSMVLLHRSRPPLAL